MIKASYDVYCMECGKFILRDTPFIGADRYKPHRAAPVGFCCEACKKSYEQYEDNVDYMLPNYKRTCKCCGTTIPENYISFYRDYCSLSCARKANVTSGKKQKSSSAKFEVKQEVSNPVESNEPEFEMYKGKILGYFKPSEMYHCYHCYKYFTWEGNKYQVYWNPKKSEWHIFCSPKHRELFANAPALGKILTGKRYKMHERSRNFQNKSKELSVKISKAGEAASRAMQNKIINGRFAKGLIKLYTKMGIIPDENKRNEMQEKNPPTIGDYLKNFGKNFGKAFKSPFGKKKDE